jgi:hypothetical protein
MPIEVPQRDDCPFCRNIAGVESAVAGQTAVVYEDDLTFVFVSPAALGGMEGHLTPFPPAQWVERTPADERQALAARIRAHW